MPSISMVPIDLSSVHLAPTCCDPTRRLEVLGYRERWMNMLPTTKT